MKKEQPPFGPETPNYAILNEQHSANRPKAGKPGPKPKSKKEPAITKSVLPLLLLSCALYLSACATTPAGIAREQALRQQVQTDINWTRDNLLPVVPSPWKEALTLLALGATTALGMWNHNQGKRITSLENGNIKVPVKVIPPLAPLPAPQTT